MICFKLARAKLREKSDFPKFFFYFFRNSVFGASAPPREPPAPAVAVRRAPSGIGRPPAPRTVRRRTGCGFPARPGGRGGLAERTDAWGQRPARPARSATARGQGPRATGLRPGKIPLSPVFTGLSPVVPQPGRASRPAGCRPAPLRPAGTEGVRPEAENGKRPGGSAQDAPAPRPGTRAPGKRRAGATDRRLCPTRATAQCGAAPERPYPNSQDRSPSSLRNTMTMATGATYFMKNT